MRWKSSGRALDEMYGARSEAEVAVDTTVDLPKVESFVFTI